MSISLTTRHITRQATRVTSRQTATMLRYPAADRNKEAILQVFSNVMKIEGKDDKSLKALEIGSGSGQHITHLATNWPNIQWQPSDVDNRLFQSIDCYIKYFNLNNVLPPIPLDVSLPVNQWPIPWPSKLDLIVCINVIHITPWKCTLGLFEGSGALLVDKTGLLITYGPYSCNGILTPESNVNFDLNLREQNPEWGVRDMQDLKQLAARNGLAFVGNYEMPANNQILIFKKN